MVRPIVSRFVFFLVVASTAYGVTSTLAQDRGQRSAGFDATTPIKSIKIMRTDFEGSCTTGELWLNGRFVAHTLELPWKNNQSYISSVPDGTYRALMRWEAPLGWRLELKGTEPRTSVEIHVGNSLANTEGCVLVGLGVNNRTCTLKDSQLAREMLQREFYGPNPVVSPVATISVSIAYNVSPTRFTHSRGAFTKQGLRWQETSSAGPQYTFNFDEQDRDMQYIYAFDNGRKMALKLPLHGGMSQFRPNGGAWTNLYAVNRQN